MHDAPLRELWTVALIVRGVAIGAGVYRKAPAAWIAWAFFCESFSLLLRYFDHAALTGPHGPYVFGSVIAQIGSTCLLVFVTRQVSQPTATLAAVSVAASLILGGSLWVAPHWPGSPIEATAESCGIILLALGIMASISSLCVGNLNRRILAAYLILSATLMLAAPDYLTTPDLGRAFMALEIVSFSAWCILYRK